MAHRRSWKRRVPILAVVALVSGLSAAPAIALAEPPAHGTPDGPHMTGRHPTPPRPMVPRPFPPKPPFSHPHHHRFVSVWPSVFAYTSPIVSYDPPAYYDPPPVYNRMPVYDPVPPIPPSTPGTVEYPTGRYELRGDGVTTPYTWVWIPNPPPPPPPPATPQVEPPASPETPAPPDQTPSLHTRLYHWTDEQGVIHLTDVWDSVPARYQARAK